MEVLKIVHSQWNSSIWKTYLELQLLKDWSEEKIPYIKLESKDFFSEKPLKVTPLAKLICLISDQGLSRLRFSKSQVQRCKNLRVWAQKITHIGLDNLSEDERFQLHIDLEDDLPSLFLFMDEKHINIWLKRWEDPYDPLFHPSSPLNGYSLQKALKIPPGPSLGELMRYLSKEKAYGRFYTNQEALDAARKWTLENAPFL